MQLGFNWQRATQTEPDADGRLHTQPIRFAQKWSGVEIQLPLESPGFTFASPSMPPVIISLPEAFDFSPDGTSCCPLPGIPDLPLSVHTLRVSKGP